MTMTKITEYETSSITIKAFVSNAPLAEKTPLRQATHNYLGLLATKDKQTGEILDQQEFFNTNRDALIERLKKVVHNEEREDKP